jgi:hypothetical protein
MLQSCVGQAAGRKSEPWIFCEIKMTVQHDSLPENVERVAAMRKLKERRLD